MKNDDLDRIGSDLGLGGTQHEGEGRRSIERGKCKEGEEFWGRCGLNLFLTGSELTFYVGRATLLHLLDDGAHRPILQQFAANHFQSEYATTAP